MTVDYDELQDDVGPDEDSLQRLTTMVERIRALESLIEDDQKQLKQRQDELRRLGEEDIPALLDELGLSELRLADGTKVIVSEDMRLSTTGKYREIINDWLRKLGYDDVIKDEFVVPVPAGDKEIAEQLSSYLTESFYQFDRKRYVSPQTLKALIKELLAKGEDVPLNDLGAYIFKRTKLKD